MDKRTIRNLGGDKTSKQSAPVGGSLLDNAFRQGITDLVFLSRGSIIHPLEQHHRILQLCKSLNGRHYEEYI